VGPGAAPAAKRIFVQLAAQNLQMLTVSPTRTIFLPGTRGSCPALPSSLHELADTETFSCQLKTFHFQQACQQKAHMFTALGVHFTFCTVLFCIVFNDF